MHLKQSTMEKRMNKRKISLIITIFGILIIIIVATIINLKNTSLKEQYDFEVERYIKLFLFACAYVAVAYETVISAFKTCLKEEKCAHENTTLKILYEKMSLDYFINPYTNEPFSENSYIVINSYEFIEN